jgi:glycine cleavage system H protein
MASFEAAPGTVNEDPAGKGWFLKIKIKDAGELDALMNEAEYQDYVKLLDRASSRTRRGTEALLR